MSALAPVAIVPLHAGFWRRAAALTIDGLIIAIPNVFIAWQLGYGETGLGASVLVLVAYYAGFHASPMQATPGKRLLGVKVTDLEGRRIGILRGIVRYFATWLSSVILGLGYVLAAVGKKRQALHDMIAGTLVVNRKATPEEVVAGGGAMPITAGVMVAILLVFILPFVGGIVAAVAIPAYQDYVVRAKVHEVLSYAAPLKSEVEKALRQNRTYEGGPVTTLPPSAQSVEVTERGEIILTLSTSVMGAAGKIVLTPTKAASGATTWECGSENMSPKYLPQNCRK